MVDVLDSFFDEDEDGKTGYERSGNRANLDKTAACNLKVAFEGVDLKVHENPDKANQGERYCLFNFKILDALEGNEQDVVQGETYSAYFTFDAKTRKPSAVAKETEAFLILAADIMGESREMMVRSGKKQASDFLTTGGDAQIGNEYILMGEPTGKSGSTTWHRFVAESA